MNMAEIIVIIRYSDATADAFRFLARANHICEWMWPIYFKCIVLASISAIMMSIASVIFCWRMNENFDVKYLFHPIKIACVKNNLNGQNTFTDLQFQIILFQPPLGPNHTDWLFFRNVFSYDRLRCVYTYQWGISSALHIHLFAASCVLRNVQIFSGSSARLSHEKSKR